MRPWLARRPIYGHYEQLMNELLRENHTDGRNFQEKVGNFGKSFKKVG